jgi:hypothetical protein
VYGTEHWEAQSWEENSDEKRVFARQCLDYYCCCVELQQESIIMFLLFWNRTAEGVKVLGQMIGRMVWEAREENVVKSFEVAAEEKDPELDID